MSEPRREATEGEAKALASPLRLRILRICLGEARTNREIADVLGRDPATVLHHVRTLTDTGFLRALPARRGTRGAREIPYEATGKSWTIMSPGTSSHLLETFVEEVGLVPAETVDASRLGLRLTPEARDEFDRRLHELFDAFRGRDDGDAYSLFIALHPDPNRPPPPG